MNRLCVSVMIVWWLSCSMFASSPAAQTDAIDAYVKSEMHKQKIPGLSLAVVKNGKIIKAKGYGLANIELRVPATPNTVYQSGSIGKQFTAITVMMLAEEGKINLDDKISAYFADAPEHWKNITVRHLLTHTSGIKNYGETDLNYRLDYTDDELVRKAASFSPDFPPGEKWHYSNTAYVLLGILVNKVSGKFYGDVLRERVFAPLNMNTARVIDEADIIPHRAAGYRLVKDEWKNQEYVSPSLNRTADGSLYLTVNDLAKWDAALYTEKLLNKASLNMMWTPVKLNNGQTRRYGFGWFLNEIRGHRIIEHSGAWQGFRSHIARCVDDRLTVIVLANLAEASPAAIAHGVAGLYNSALRPLERQFVQLDPTILDAYVGQYAVSPDFVLTVVREGSKLLVLGLGAIAAELQAESASKFFFEGLDMEITFVKDAAGNVTHMMLRDVESLEAKKIK